MKKKDLHFRMWLTGASDGQPFTQLRSKACRSAGKIAAALLMNWVILNRASIPSSMATAAIILLPSSTTVLFRGRHWRGTEKHRRARLSSRLAHYTVINWKWSKNARPMFHVSMGSISPNVPHMPRTLKMIEGRGRVAELMDSKPPCLDIAAGFDNLCAARQMTPPLLLRARHINLRRTSDERSFIIKQKYNTNRRRCNRAVWA